ncbi:hypothetical protein OAF42_01710 [Planctomicrobium sp.]|nr:hypothetical protein [Planctomicrobium sp.]MBT5017669.1 hypothetical protein [Planctomicrobium sp.]MDA7503380.1 hypothetical protein [bacterium]MDB4439354.1 hypothetical protein [Planctomicrobium sp.]MDB4733138.1 hypothetical protein [Planctomicrobium sp.]
MIIDNGLLIGRPDGMESAVSSFLKVCRCANFFRDLNDFKPIEDSPEFILVLQHWSDEYTQTQVDELLNRFPLSRVVCCYGPWCQSDQRTRQIWPAALRVPIHQIQERIELECKVLLGNVLPIERTAGLDEVFAFQHQLPDNKI